MFNDCFLIPIACMFVCLTSCDTVMPPLFMTDLTFEMMVGTGGLRLVRAAQ